MLRRSKALIALFAVIALIAAALTRMAAAAKKFDIASVRQSDLALVAALSAD